MCNKNPHLVYTLTTNVGRDKKKKITNPIQLHLMQQLINF